LNHSYLVWLYSKIAGKNGEIEKKLIQAMCSYGTNELFTVTSETTGLQINVSPENFYQGPEAVGNKDVEPATQAATILILQQLKDNRMDIGNPSIVSPQSNNVVTQNINEGVREGVRKARVFTER
jgi:hypothetical protein